MNAVSQIDWYERRHELEEGQVFQSCYGLVKLDHRKPGDGTQWVVATWNPGYPPGETYPGAAPYWCYDESTIEPGDLEGEPLPDPKP